MEYKKDLLLRSAARLYSLGIEVEGARQRLRDLVNQGVAYESPEMRKALEDYQELDQKWKALEQEYLKLRNIIYQSEYRHRKYDRIGIQYFGCDDVEVVIEGTSLSGFIAGLTCMTNSDFHKRCVKSDHAVSFCFSRLDKSIGHGKAVSVFSGTSCNHNNSLTHNDSPLT